MFIISAPGGVRRIGRLAFLTIASASVACLLLFGAIWLRSLLSRFFFLRAELVVLIAVEILYVAMAVLSFLGVLVLLPLWLRGRRTGKIGPVAALRCSCAARSLLAWCWPRLRVQPGRSARAL